MGSCCTNNVKAAKIIKTDEIIDLTTNDKQNQKNQVVIVTPQTRRTVPQLKKLQNNPLYKRRRRKSLNDATLSNDLQKNVVVRKKRLTMSSNMELIKNKLFTNAIGEIHASLPKIKQEL